MKRYFFLLLIFCFTIPFLEAGRGGDTLYDRNMRNQEQNAYDRSPSMSRSGQNYYR